MSDPTRALRGAVDLSSLGGAARPGQPPTSAGAGQPAAAPSSAAPRQSAGQAADAGGAIDGPVVEATDATFNQIVSRTSVVPAVAIVWSSQHPQSRALLDDVILSLIHISEPTRPAA